MIETQINEDRMSNKGHLSAAGSFGELEAWLSIGVFYTPSQAA